MRYIICIIFIVVTITSSCDSTSSNNEELDNMWYLTKIDSLSSGNSIDYRPKRVFWSFQGTLLQINSAYTSEKYMCFFVKDSEELKIFSPFRYDRINGDVMLTEETLEEIIPFGIDKLSAKYTIDKLDDGIMILNDSAIKLTFEKY